jgi:hypothetical protein
MVVCTNGVQPYHGDYEYTNAANKIYYMFWKKGSYGLLFYALPVVSYNVSSGNSGI